MTERSHLSIGEVLSLLREEFPEVTISKIRFLESQGLVDPERTPSGYRKFYDHDVERLRWILHQQREKFLPLKVIKGKLSEQGEDPAVPGAEPEASLAPAEPAASVGATAPTAAPPDSDGARRAAPVATPSARPARGSAGLGLGDRPRAGATPTIFAGIRKELDETAATASLGRGDAEPRSHSRREGALSDVEDAHTAEELARASGASASLIDELRQFGMITPETTVAGTDYYDDSALDVVKAAAGFGRYGVEVRHLRVWRNFADREADLFQQVVLPLLRQRNPQARQQAVATLEELARTGAALREALVRKALRDIK
jgi:DNA-binding transcriptional MerR regulator